MALLVARALQAKRPDAHILITSGTRTSADLIARRAPDLLHAYIPLDTPAATRAFIAHWRPDLGVFLESEIWPNLLLEAKKADAKLALINARLSPKSLASWRSRKASGRHLFSLFDAILCADQRTAGTLAFLRGEPARVCANLKLAAPAPDVDATQLAALRAEIGARPVWIAASTHEGEDEIALTAHGLLRRDWPEALLILIPRHPARGAAIAALAQGAPRRALSESIAASPVYVADTLGEMGVFFSVAPVSLIGGSLLSQLKGHNPVEAARLNSNIVTGPFVESFSDLFAALEQAGGAAIVRDATSLAAQVALLWGDENERARRIKAAHGALNGGEEALQTTIATLEALVPDANPVTVAAHASA